MQRLKLLQIERKIVSFNGRRFYVIKSKNFYDVLGLTASATQGDIKSAYFKLSMTYHPDKNKGSTLATDKFREITEAYEVLGNFRLRKLYDKGIIHGRPEHHASHHHHHNHHHHHQEEDDSDPTMRFYKSRMKKEHRTAATGRTPIYDFDEWTESHYGETLKKNQAKRKKIYEAAEKREREKLLKQNDTAIIVLFAAMLIFTIVHELSPDYDRVKKKSDIDKN